MNDILNHRLAIQANIRKSFGVDADDLEKGHNVGDVHPTKSNLVWTEYKPGKFDWRGVKGGAKGGNAAAAAPPTTAPKKETPKAVPGKAEERTGENIMKKEKDEIRSSARALMNLLSTIDNKYNDSREVTVMKTPKGNWQVSYMKKKVATVGPEILSEEAAKANRWFTMKMPKVFKDDLSWEIEYSGRGHDGGYKDYKSRVFANSLKQAERLARKEAKEAGGSLYTVEPELSERNKKVFDEMGLDKHMLLVKTDKWN